MTTVKVGIETNSNGNTNSIQLRCIRNTVQSENQSFKGDNHTLLPKLHQLRFVKKATAGGFSSQNHGNLFAFVSMCFSEKVSHNAARTPNHHTSKAHVLHLFSHTVAN